MTGPKITRLDTTPQPSLNPIALDFLKSAFGPGYSGGSITPSSAANPTTAAQTFQQMFTNPALSDILGGKPSGEFGQSVLAAAKPVFADNLKTALATQRQSGPRFSSGQDLLAGQTSQKALNDFNLFSQQVLQQGQQTQLQAALGQLPIMGEVLKALFQGGGINSAPGFIQSPSALQQFTELLAAGAGIALGLKKPGLPSTNKMGGGGGVPGSIPFEMPDLSGLQIPRFNF